jgi:branched-chain amino acid transport system substrate-binding protein
MGVFKQQSIRSRAQLSIVSCLVILLVGLSACSQGQTQTSGNGPALDNSNPITIGISISKTGSFSSDGIATLQGYQIWQQMVNASGGILGRPVQLDIMNDNSDPNQVAKNYTTMITKHHDNLIMGPFSTLLTKAAAPVADQYHYALVEGEGGAPSVFHPQDAKGNLITTQRAWSNVYDVSLPVANNLITFAYYILSLPRSLRPKTVAYLTSDDPFTYPQLDPVRRLLSQAGVVDVYDKMYTEGKDSTPYAQQVARSHAQIDILGTLLPDITTDIKVFKQEHYNPDAIIATAGPDLGQDFVNAVGGIKYTEGMFVPNGWYPQATNFQNAQMVQAYISRFGGTANEVNADVAEAFSAGQVLDQAATNIHSINNAALLNELNGGTVFNTVQGTVKFDQYGENVQALSFLFQWQNGQFIPVYPLPSAAENPVYPKPDDF